MKKKFYVLAVLLLAVITTTYSVSGTYAKYTSTFEGGTDSARVASWAFGLNGNDAFAENSYVFDLFKTINDSDGTEETDVAKGTDENIIAPGTSGSFEINLANWSEVNAKYSIDLTVDNTEGIPVEFSIDELFWYGDVTDMQTLLEDEIAMGGEATITIYWRWTFEVDQDADSYIFRTDDTYDTYYGTNSNVFEPIELSVKADVTVTQVD